MSSDFLKRTQTTIRFPSDYLVGDLLLRAGLVTQSQLDESLRLAGNNRGQVGQMLVMAKYLTSRDLQAAIDAQTAIRGRQVDMNTAVKGLSIAHRHGITFAEGLRQQDEANPCEPTSQLGELLVAANIIDCDQYAKAMHRSLAIGLPLGRILVLNGAISEQLLATVLDIQVRIKDEMLTYEEGLECVRQATELGNCNADSIERVLQSRESLQIRPKKGMRLGEFLVLAGVLNETDVMNALELGLATGQFIGEILVNQGFIEQELLENALELQGMVEEDRLECGHAAHVLGRIHTEGIGLQAALEEVTSEQPAIVDVSFAELLTMASVVTEDDIRFAVDAAVRDPQVLAKILSMTGHMNEAVCNATLKCHSFVAKGYLNQEDAVVALDYCMHKLNEDQPITFEECLHELGWTVNIPANDAELGYEEEGQVQEDGTHSFEPPIGDELLDEQDESPIFEEVGEQLADEFISQMDEFSSEEEVQPEDAIGDISNADEETMYASFSAEPEPQADYDMEVVEANMPRELSSASDQDLASADSSYEESNPKTEPLARAKSASIALTALVSKGASKKGAQAGDNSIPPGKEVAGKRHSNEPNKAGSGPRPSNNNDGVSAPSHSQQTKQPIQASQSGQPSKPNQGKKTVVSLKALLASGSEASAETGDGKTKSSAADASGGNTTADKQTSLKSIPKKKPPTSGQSSELELSEEDERIIAAASSLTATPEDLQAAAKILADKEKILGLSPAKIPPKAQRSVTLSKSDTQVMNKLDVGSRSSVDMNAASHVKLGDAYFKLAESYYEQGNYVEAENLYSKILDMREKQLGIRNPAIILDLNNLAGVLCIQGKFEAAEIYVQRAINIIESNEPGELLKLADELNTLAGIYYQQDKLKQCEPLLERALRLRERALGDDHPDLADNLKDYAKFLKKTNRNEEAEKFYTKARQILAGSGQLVQN